MDSDTRRLSLYFESETIKTEDNLSDYEKEEKPFRVRSGTDISDSLNIDRYKGRTNLMKYSLDNPEKEHMKASDETCEQVTHTKSVVMKPL